MEEANNRFSHSEKLATNQQRYAQFAPAKFRHFVPWWSELEKRRKKNRGTMGSLQMHKDREREGKEEPRRMTASPAPRDEKKERPTRPAYSNRLPKFDPVH
ncbi:hypothetical protein SDJN03_09685, partial [Cucurbita argyrosperma subsp. sororia]